MTIDRLEARAARYSDEMAAERLTELRNAYAINRLEGAKESPTADRLLRLYATGRVTDAEYQGLALAYARGDFGGV